MRITVVVSGFYDWAPCPPGTEITEADVQALRVKQMTDDRWHMRVEREAAAGHHHDVGIHEEAVCRRMAALMKIGRPKNRAQVVVEMLESSMVHHLDADHVMGVEVHDDGPNEAMFRVALNEAGILEVDHDRLVGSYLTARDIQRIVAGYLGVQS